MEKGGDSTYYKHTDMEDKEAFAQRKEKALMGKFW